MNKLKFEFFGTSHGEGYSGKIWGLPKGFVVDEKSVNFELSRRKQGFGRSDRQNETADIVEFLSNTVTSEPLTFFVKNANVEQRKNFSAVRSGHVDLVGAAKHNTTDLRSLNEVASGRSSLCYVVLGAVCKQILSKYGIFTKNFVKSIGGSQDFEAQIAKAKQTKNSVGGIVSVVASGAKLGQIGDFFPYEKRLDGLIAGAMLGIPSVKGIEFGIGQQFAKSFGKAVADKLEVSSNQIAYATNNAGGIVAGISNGCDIYFELTVKPVPTVSDVETIDLVSKEIVTAHFERADTCIVETVGIVAENLLAAVLLDQILGEKPC